MDKATAEKVLDVSIAFARGFRSGCSANVTDEIDLLTKLRKERAVFLAENPVVKDSLTTDPKPQGGGEWWITKIKKSGMITTVSNKKPSDWILGKHDQFEVIYAREATP